MKALFRPFALHAAYTPIETIVFFCIIGTLAYFHILNAIKHSTFLDPAGSGNVYSPPVMKPAHVLWRLGEWVSVRESRIKSAAAGGSGIVVDVQQLVFTVDSARTKGNEVCIFFFLLASLFLKHVLDIRPSLADSSPALLVYNQHFTTPHHGLSLYFWYTLSCLVLSTLYCQP